MAGLTHLQTPTADVPSAKSAARRDFASFVFAQSRTPYATKRRTKK